MTSQLGPQIDEVRAAQDTVGNEKASIEKQNRTLQVSIDLLIGSKIWTIESQLMTLFLQAQLSDVQRKCDEANLILGDNDNAKKKVVIENADLLRQVSSARRVWLSLS